MDLPTVLIDRAVRHAATKTLKRVTLPPIPGFSGKWRWRQFPGPGGVEFRQIVLVEAVASGPKGGNNAREWRVVPNSSGGRPGGQPAIGAFHLYAVSRIAVSVTAKTAKFGSGSIEIEPA